MANRFDPRGAMLGAALVGMIALLAAAVLFGPKRTVAVKIDLPPAQSAQR